MTFERRRPTLSQQIEAVQWAWAHAWDTGKRAHMRDGEIAETSRRLEEAIATLQMLEEGERQTDHEHGFGPHA